MEVKNLSDNVDATYFVKFIPGYKPTPDELEEALQGLIAGAAEWRSK